VTLNALQVQQGTHGPSFSARQRAVLLLLILALGGCLRFWGLGSARLGYDHCYPAYDALRLLDGHQWTLSGQPSSVFLDNPALMGYLQAVPLLLWRSPWSIYIAIAALNTVAIWFAFRAAERMLGTPVGLLAAFLFATNPWVVHFSRTAWVQALVPLCTSVVACGFWPGLVTGRSKRGDLLVGDLGFLVMTQTYVQSWGIALQLAPLLAWFRPRVPRSALLILVALLAVASCVYCAGLLRGWNANRAKLARFREQQDLHLTREGLDHAVRLVTGLDYETAYATTGSDKYLLRRRLSLAAHYILCIALAAGAARGVLSLLRKGPERRVAAVLLVWFAVPILLTSAAASPVHPHYLLLSCPAGHVLAAWGLTLPCSKRFARAAVTSLMVFVAVLFAANLRQANLDVAAAPTAPRFDGWSLEAGSRVGKAVRELTQGVSYPRRVVCEAHEAVLSNLSATYLSILRDVHYPRYVALPGEEPLLYVLVDKPIEPGVLGPLEESFSGHELTFADGTRVRFVRAQPYSRRDALALPAEALDWQSEAGLTFLGYSLGEPGRAGAALSCTTYWRVEELKPGRDAWSISAFYHVVSRAGATVSNVSGHGQWASSWRLGDVHIERVALPLPADLTPGEYQLEIGLFDSIHGKSYALLPQGNPTYAFRVAVPVRGSP
jgi:4-amino-4-deoxy-L-arabinose transferase-like glycosyltransferase